RLQAGHVYIAPGGQHMVVEREGGVLKLALNTEPPENSCRPAVDVLFRSVAWTYGAKSLAVILTGMGSDGLRGCEYIAEAGGRVIVQDEASSVVWGMPGFVARAGLAERQLPLQQVAGEITRLVGEGRGRMARAG
ncbi:MAG: CheB methylesterase domain-containing protein, partial [Phycisphaerales bacterium]